MLIVTGRSSRRQSTGQAWPDRSARQHKASFLTSRSTCCQCSPFRRVFQPWRRSSWVHFDGESPSVSGPGKLDEAPSVSAPQHLAVEAEEAILADRVEHARPRADRRWRWHLGGGIAGSVGCVRSVDLRAAPPPPAGDSIGSRAMQPDCNGGQTATRASRHRLEQDDICTREHKHGMSNALQA